MNKQKDKRISAKELDKRFNDGESILKYADIDSLEVYSGESKKIIIDLPSWMIKIFDAESLRLGIPRQAVIKTMLDQKIKDTMFTNSRHK